MECTVCEQSNLLKGELEEGLPCLQCSKCGGSWLEAEAYQQWVNSPAQPARSKSSTPVNLVSGESPGLKFCPRCAHILIKYKVGHDINFTIDRCGFCAGVWLDQHEWDLLKAHSLHEQLYSLFSQEWQSEVRAAEHKKAMEDILRDRLGESDYTEFTRIKNWLDNHAKAEELYALLFGSASKTRQNRILQASRNKQTTG